MGSYKFVGERILSAVLVGATYGAIDYMVEKAFDKMEEKRKKKESEKNIVNVKKYTVVKEK